MKKFLLSIIIALFCISSIASPVIKFITIGGIGSQGDTAIRYLSPLIDKETGIPSIIVNKPGANGVIALQEFNNKTNSKEITILIGSALLAYLSNNDKTIDYDPLKELEPVYGLTKVDSIIVVPSNSPIRTISDIKKFYKDTGRIIAGSMSAMTTITTQLLDQKLGNKTDIVLYRSPIDLSMNLTMGLLNYALAPAGGGAFAPFIESGQLRVVGVIGDKRNVSFPSVISTKELGYSGIEDFGWTAFFINKNAPEDTKQMIASAIEKALRSKEAAGFSQLIGKPQIWFADKNTVRAVQYRELPFLIEPKE